MRCSVVMDGAYSLISFFYSDIAYPVSDGMTLGLCARFECAHLRCSAITLAFTLLTCASLCVSWHRAARQAVVQSAN